MWKETWSSGICGLCTHYCCILILVYLAVVQQSVLKAPCKLLQVCLRGLECPKTPPRLLLMTCKTEAKRTWGGKHLGLCKNWIMFLADFYLLFCTYLRHSCSLKFSNKTLLSGCLLKASFDTLVTFCHNLPFTFYYYICLLKTNLKWWYIVPIAVKFIKM